jgi:hypothetical protein
MITVLWKCKCYSSIRDIHFCTLMESQQQFRGLNLLVIVCGVYQEPPLPRRDSYFEAVMGLAWSCDSESYAGGSVATGRVSHVREVKADDPEKRDTLVLQVGDWA